MTWIWLRERVLDWAWTCVLACYLAGAIAGGWAIGSDLSKGRGSWRDLPCVAVWPVCISYVEVGRYFRQPDQRGAPPKRAWR